ncbi:MAG: zinc ribbon domain-containing protein [Actinobacteria bacterium]|nr:zinc ribbon domain-containing protein [Actinomycetota bacterium]
MPIVRYRCEECGNRFEAFVRRLDEAEEAPGCERCGSRKVKSAFTVIGEGGPRGSVPAPVCEDCATCASRGGCAVRAACVSR